MNEIVEKVTDMLADKIIERMSGKFGQLQDKVDEQEGKRVLYTVKQVCEMLHISKSKLYRHQKMGYISPSEYVGRTPLYDQQVIDDYLNNFRYYEYTFNKSCDRAIGAGNRLRSGRILISITTIKRQKYGK